MAANKNTFIVNPYTGTPIFGRVPEMTFKKHYFHEGDIFLKHGEHRGFSQGFGATHIWEAHQHELLLDGYSTVDCVARFIADITRSGASIHSEFNDIRGNHRLTVVKSSAGLAILQPYTDGVNGNYYSVVTAYRHKKAHGIKIGTMR